MDKEVDKRRILTNIGLWWHFIKSTTTNIKKSKVNYCLGFSACFLVVFVVALLVTILSKTPLVFMRLAEQDKGEMDAVVTPLNGFNNINYTFLANSVLTDSPYNFHTPRRLETLEIYFSSDCPELDPLDTFWKYHPQHSSDFCFTVQNCFLKHCPAVAHSATILFTNSIREKEILLGRDWKLPPLKKGEAYIHENLAKSTNAKIGEYMYIPFHLGHFFGHDTWGNLTGISQDTLTYIPFKIVDIYYNPYGKHEMDLLNVVMIEYDEFVPYMVDHLDPSTYNTSTKENVSKIELRDFASSVIINFPPPRVSAYLESNYDTLQHNVIQFANTVFYKIGFTQIETTLPVLLGLFPTKIISLFLGLILNIIIFILLFLSILLIYSLLMINVETRTFELGVMRMTGTSRHGIIMLLMVQAFSYAIPSWLLGIVLAESFTFFLANWLSSFIGVPLEPNLSGMGFLWATLLGLLVPVVSSILPILDALGQNLHDSLDTRKSKVSAVKVKLKRSDPTQAISWQLVVVGAGLAIFGATIYYAFPLALLAMNLGLLLNLFFFILIGMLLGLTVLSLNLQPAFERAILFVFFFWENQAIRSITSKNMIAHRIRNRKTTIMYALSLGFIIFISVAYSLQVQTFSYNQQQKNGCFLKVAFSTGSDQNGMAMMKEKLEKLAVTHPKIVHHAWISTALDRTIPGATRSDIYHIGQVLSFSQSVYAVSPGFYDATLKDFLKTSDTGGIADKELSRFLYSRDGLGSALVSSLYVDGLVLGMNTDFLLGVGLNAPQDQTYRRVFRLKPAAFMDASPGFRFSPYPAIFRQDMVMGFTTFYNFLKNSHDSIEDVPVSSFLIKMVDDIKSDEVDDIIFKLQDALAGFTSATIWDYRNTIAPFEVATVAMTYFFNFTTIVAMLISFFSLMSSMFTNVHEQTKEIAVLRALGISKFWMYKIYVYEAFVLVLASSLLGIMIGVVVGYTMTLQQVLFTQLPIPFVFPWTIMITVFVCSVLFSILAAFSPIYRVLQKRVVQIFRLVS